MKKAKILIVEDDENLALLIEARLKASNYDVRTANNAEEAYRIYFAFKPLLVLTDIGIGEENGIDLIKRIRSQGGDVVTIYMTGDLERYHAALVREKKLHHAKVIGKPFTADELIALVSAQARGQQKAA